MEIAVLINAATSGPTPGLSDAVARAAEIKARFLLLVSSWIPGVFVTFFCTPDDLGHWQQSETAERLTRWPKIGRREEVRQEEILVAAIAAARAKSGNWRAGCIWCNITAPAPQTDKKN
jgi:hypothetical protein